MSIQATWFATIAPCSFIGVPVTRNPMPEKKKNARQTTWVR